MSLFEDEQYPENVLDMVFGFQKSRVILTAFELDLFTALGDDKKTSQDVASILGTDKRATDRLMNALCALGLLKKENEFFSNTPIGSLLLIRGKPDYVEGLMHMVHLWESWSTLTDAVRKGSAVYQRPGGERGEQWRKAFIAAMHNRAHQTAPGIIDLIDISNVSRVLDVGGGSGAYAMAFVRARDNITATIFDLPAIIPLTERYIDEAGLSGKIVITGGDYNTDEFEKGYDIVFLSAIIHSNSPALNKKLIKKCAESLNANGQVIVQDFIMNEDRTMPLFGALFSLNMLVGTESGDTYTEGEVRTWMQHAGLTDIARKDSTFGTSLISGRKR